MPLVACRMRTKNVHTCLECKKCLSVDGQGPTSHLPPFSRGEKRAISTLSTSSFGSRRWSFVSFSLSQLSQRASIPGMPPVTTHSPSPNDLGITVQINNSPNVPEESMGNRQHAEHHAMTPLLLETTLTLRSTQLSAW